MLKKNLIKASDLLTVAHAIVVCVTARYIMKLFMVFLTNRRNDYRERLNCKVRMNLIQNAIFPNTSYDLIKEKYSQ